MCVVAAQATAAATASRLTLAEIVRAHGDAYRRTHRLATVQRVALRAIAACRTALLGGRRETCDHCGATRLAYNSCRNRHCATCQGRASAQWVTARRADLLPIPYFHVVFTLPHALNALAQGNPRVMYALLFRAAADTLLTFGRDPRHLGGTIGVTAILHTWSQTLTQHLHVHCLVTGGAVSRDHTRWIARARHLLDAPTPTASADVPAPTADPTRCPVCHQGHWQVETLSPLPRRPVALGFDTS